MADSKATDSTSTNASPPSYDSLRKPEIARVALPGGASGSGLVRVPASASGSHYIVNSNVNNGKVYDVRVQVTEVVPKPAPVKAKMTPEMIKAKEEIEKNNSKSSNNQSLACIMIFVDIIILFSFLFCGLHCESFIH